MTAYQVLARKWRPRNFQELVGQEHVLRPLVNALDAGRLHHAYLFTGTRGVGKTTIARIIAKCLNCQTGITSKPCGTCTACQEIDQGRFIDLIEVDAASRTKVEDTRELLDNVQYAPTHGRYKIYLIDEVHMLSGHSFNALLKTLEEPPEHVKFLLATTDPKRLPITVLSRCLQFHLKNLSPELIEQHLQDVLTKENIPFETPALKALSHAANGSVRDSLSLLDQAIAYGGGHVRATDVASMLGTIEQHQIEQLLHALAEKNIATVMQCCRDMATHAIDFGQVLEELLSLLHRLAVIQLVPDTATTTSGTSETELLSVLAKQISPEDIQLWYQIGLIGRRDLPLAPTPLSGFEMILLRMLVFRPEVQIPPIPPFAKGGDQIPPPPSAAPPFYKGGEKTQPFEKKEENSPPLKTTQSFEEENSPPFSERGNQTSTLRKDGGRTPPLKKGVAAEGSGGIYQKESWPDLLPQLQLVGLSQTLATHCSLVSFENDRMQLALSSKHITLLTPNATERIEQALTKHFQKPIKLDISTQADTLLDTPAALKQQQITEHQQTALNTLQNDTNLQMLLKTFDATIRPETIKSK